MWVIRIKQYFQVRNYALWEVIENGNSWASVPQTTQENGTSVTKMSVHVTAKEKTNKKNDVKARSLLLMALPNEHQLTFSQYSDAKIMFAAIETRFKNFQKILVEWGEADIETMSIDDLYNNFKIVEQDVKKSVGASSGAQNLAFITAPSTSSTNDVNTDNPAYEVSTVSPNINTACLQVSTVNFSDNIVYAFMVENPNGSNLLHRDLEQIHEDDLEAMDLKWQLSLLSMRAKMYFQRTGKKIFINANDTVGYDKSKVSSNIKTPLGRMETMKTLFNSNSGYRWSRFFDLDDMAEEQITKKSKKGLGYNVVPPPHPLIYNPSKKLDLSYSGLDEFKDPEFKSYGSKGSKLESNIICDTKSDDSKENSDNSLVKEQVSEDTNSFVESSLNVDKETGMPHRIAPGGAHVSHRCVTKKNYVLFTDTECLVLSPNFKLADESQILLKIPKKDNMYSFDMKNIVPKESLTCLVANATSDESMLWHRRTWTDNGTKFKNKVMDDFCREKGIKREYSVARTPRQNGVAKRRNRTLIEAARTNEALGYPTTELEVHKENLMQHPKEVMLFDNMLNTASPIEPTSIAKALSNSSWVEAMQKELLDSPFELVAYTDSDYAGATQDRKSTTGGCQFLGNRLISWQCKKQTVVATSTTEAEYVAAANCCGQVLWIQNQLLDYGYNFMNTVINIDNNSTICIIENPVQHSKTKHIEIRHHFIRDCNAKKLIQMVKIHTDYNVADLLTKGFDAGSQVWMEGYVISKVCYKNQKHLGKSKEVGTPRYLSLVAPLKKVGDEAVHKELGDRMERAATTASSLEAEQDSGSGPRCQDTILGDVNAQTRFEITSKQSNDPPLSRGYTLGSGEDSMKQLELMELSAKAYGKAAKRSMIGLNASS
ncbi:ribonuclease H-like domain-containing protein [Tanacetum coccineum]|uniref:Ribonuclease H-like domain-containing protein n=1 Tax=Tanacetum coccineum TaxID=301880 RepID=A0ABQ5IQX5_9ASTR